MSLRNAAVPRRTGKPIQSAQYLKHRKLTLRVKLPQKPRKFRTVTDNHNITSRISYAAKILSYAAAYAVFSVLLSSASIIGSNFKNEQSKIISVADIDEC